MNQSEIPQGWEEKSLGSIAKRIISGSTPSTSNPDYWDGEIVWVTPDDLSQNDNMYMHSSSRRITSKGLSHSSASLIPKKSIVMSSRAPIGYVAIMNVEYATNQGCKSLELKDAVPEFVYYSLIFNMPMIRQQGEGTTFAEISKTQLEKVSLVLPKSPNEQRNIADVLQTADRAIERTKELIEKHRRIKNGLMRDLIRPQAIPTHWKTKSIAEIAIVNPSQKKGISDSTAVTFLAMEDISEEGRIVKRNVRSYKEVKNGFTSFQENDVIFAKITPCMENGKGAFADDLVNGIGFGSTEFHILRAKRGNDALYIYYLTTDKRLRISAEASMTGTAGQQRVQSDFFADYRLPVPKEKEQKDISNKLRTMDSRIISEEKYLDKLIKIKTGLMQDLLTGKVRVAA